MRCFSRGDPLCCKLSEIASHVRFFLVLSGYQSPIITIQEYRSRNVTKCLDNAWLDFWFLGNKSKAQ